MIGSQVEPGGKTVGSGLQSVSGMFDRRLRTRAALVIIVGVGGFLRLWELGRVGFNSDESVYTGQAASLIGDPQLRTLFPVFRAHPLVFPVLLALVLHTGVSDTTARVLPVAFGIATVLVAYLLGRLLYGEGVGLVAAALLAVMPYSVVVSRQVLLDGPMAFFATGTLYCLARFCRDRDERWLYSAGAVMGLTILTKEAAVLLLAGVFEFFALARTRAPKWREALTALAIMCGVLAVYVVALVIAGKVHTGEQYLLWQSGRPPNHPYSFYWQVVPPAIGWGVTILAVVGLVWMRRQNSWRELLLALWVAIPVAIFTFVLGVKGFQYLEFAAPVMALLAARAVVLARIPRVRPESRRRVAAAGAAAVALVATMAVTTWGQINPAPSASFLAGSGGLPGGRETGRWVAGHVPLGGQLLTVGPSMANIIQFYGHRRALALSVSPNPLGRNPSYVPVNNPDFALRQGTFQYLVWDTYSAQRSQNFSGKLLAYVRKYHGVAVYTQSIVVDGPDGRRINIPAIIIYEVTLS
jgi:4-amino-4-deoxy-L-arabinose transferase-like glycosyltransferase